MDYLTLLFDFKGDKVIALPARAYGMSWAPIPHLFPVPFHTDVKENDKLDK